MEKKVQVAIKRLDELIQKLEDYKPLLEQNVTCAEFEIRANFNSLMEFLSERQGTLLKQLKNVAKEKALLIESNRQTLESLRAAIVSSQTTKKDVDCKIPEYLNKVESLVLNESLIPFVTFRAESNRLKQSVSSYGRLASRYPGHFADPSQPSTCLPRALEEEDDHDINPAPSAVLGRAANLCPCMDPKLRQWLSPSEHRCKYEKSKLDHGDTVSVSSRSISGYDHNFEGTTIGDLTEQTSKLDLYPALSSVHIPHYPLKSTIVRKWLELREEKPALKRPSNSPSAMTNSSLTRVLHPSQPDSSGAPSASFDVLTESSVAGNLKDWLFCDSMELSDMPGLSSTIQSRACPTLNTFKHPRIEEAQLKKQTTEPAVSDTGSRTSVWLPAHLDSSSSIDLNRWLRPRETTESEPNHTDPVVADPLKKVEQQVMNTMDTTPVVTDCPIQTSDCTIQKCPLYGQCPSGPGGPTCCASSFMNTAVACCPDELEFPSSVQDDTSDLAKLSAEPDCDSQLTTTCSFDRIAATDWKQWIAPSEPIGVTNSN